MKFLFLFKVLPRVFWQAKSESYVYFCLPEQETLEETPNFRGFQIFA